MILPQYLISSDCFFKWSSFCKTFTLSEKEQQEFWSLWARMDRKKTGEVNAETFRKTWYLLPTAEVSDESNREVILDKDAPLSGTGRHARADLSGEPRGLSEFGGVGDVSGMTQLEVSTDSDAERVG